MKRTCPICRKEFIIYPSTEKRHLVCSVECKREKEKNNKIKKVCPECGKEHTVNKSKARNHDYCSATCRRVALNKKAKRKCKSCKNTFIAHIKEQSFCSLGCKEKYFQDRKQGQAERIRKRAIEWYNNNKQKAKERIKEWKQTEKGKECIKKVHTNYKNKYQKLVFNHYGNKCFFCGSTKKLNIDHINNDGAEYRKKYKTAIWIWIIKNNYPDDLQVLCQICNERKKHAFKEGITLKKWTEDFNKKINDIIDLKKSGKSFSKIAKTLNITKSNCANLYYRYRESRGVRRAQGI